MATSRLRRPSRARYTSPMPPAPRGAVISYGPTRVPEANIIPAGPLHSSIRPANGVSSNKKRGSLGSRNSEGYDAHLSLFPAYGGQAKTSYIAVVFLIREV